ncbi:MAG: TetR/AcrR family transcriptional regulator [Pseudochelatococcus sp.]|jgi:AcrR family transcriptional regulator|uniref:TetR/AcrR family transcriptional regulator n=1 Tax=Pseudochelatococcus sp. TaxID=2020869 RepID=UPI003D8F827E
MPDSHAASPSAAQPPRRRLSKEERLAQLMDVAWQLVREGGTDALTLGRLAEAAGVTKPVVYDHFGTRHGLLAVLYRDFDTRQTAIIDAAIAASGQTLEEKVRVFASSYIGCALAEGRELPEVAAALSGSPELAAMKKQCQQTYIEKCRQILSPFSGSGDIPKAALWALLGAADALSAAVIAREISEEDAYSELCRFMRAMIKGHEIRTASTMSETESDMGN